MQIIHDNVIKPDGSAGTYDYVKLPDFVVIIPIVDNQYYLVDQFRYPTQKQSLEFPMGSIEKNEDLQIAAVRELREETGLISNKCVKIGYIYVGNGMLTNGFHVFVATECSKSKTKYDSSETDMQTKIMSLNQIKKYISSGVITDGPTIAAFGLYITRYAI